MMLHRSRGGASRLRDIGVSKRQLVDPNWGMRGSAVQTRLGKSVSRKLFALLGLLPQGVHVSSMCEILGVGTIVLDPLITKLVRAGKVEKVGAPGQFIPNGVYRLTASQED